MMIANPHGTLVLDQLLAEIPRENIAKLEIYTFGSAASHMSNPPASQSPAPGDSSSKLQTQQNGSLSHAQPNGASMNLKPRQIISHIEHYANEYDMVPRWGVLHSVYNLQNNRYAGSVFVMKHQSGHMFNQHASLPCPLSKYEPAAKPHF